MATNHQLECFTYAYIEALLWSSYDNADPETGGEPLDVNYSPSDISDEAMARIEADCKAFYEANEAHIHCNGAPQATDDATASESEREAAMAGHDFWLTRCGHGAGFWDGDWPEPHASALDAASKAAGNVDPYVGDDGQIYLA